MDSEQFAIFPTLSEEGNGFTGSLAVRPSPGREVGRPVRKLIRSLGEC